MKKTVLVILIFACTFSLCACSEHLSQSGLDYFRKSNGATSSFGIASDLLVSVEFLDTYPYLNGDFYHDYLDKGWNEGTIDRAFIWLTYERETYEQAKQECIETREGENPDLDGKQAFGFTFYVNCEWDEDNELQKFPRYFTAFGYNDEKCTLVFIGFYGGQYGADMENVETAKTDLEGFIKNYFGEWYDWEE